MDFPSLPRVMVAVAQSRTLEEVLHAITAGIAQCGNVVLARIWLIQGGDVCATCRFRSDCPDQIRCLHLVSSAGNSRNPSTSYTRLDGSFRRFPLGVRKIGQVGQSGEPQLLTRLHGNEAWIADPTWVLREGVRSCVAQPLVFRGEVLGVLAVFDSGALGEADAEWLRVFADHAAVSIANARALEEIQRLRARLEDENEISVQVYGLEEVSPEHLVIECHDGSGREVKVPLT